MPERPEEGFGEADMAELAAWSGGPARERSNGSRRRQDCGTASRPGDRAGESRPRRPPRTSRPPGQRRADLPPAPAWWLAGAAAALWSSWSRPPWRRARRRRHVVCPTSWNGWALRSGRAELMSTTAGSSCASRRPSSTPGTVTSSCGSSTLRDEDRVARPAPSRRRVRRAERCGPGRVPDRRRLGRTRRRQSGPLRPEPPARRAHVCEELRREEIAPRCIRSDAGFGKEADQFLPHERHTPHEEVPTTATALAGAAAIATIPSGAGAQESATVSLMHGIPGVTVDVVVDGAVVDPRLQAGHNAGPVVLRRRDPLQRGGAGRRFGRPWSSVRSTRSPVPDSGQLDGASPTSTPMARRRSRRSRTTSPRSTPVRAA